LILKTFIFQFINSFNAIFYMAFLKRSNEGCIAFNPDTDKTELSSDNLCSVEVSNQVRTIMIISLVKNVIEIGVPFAKSLLKKYKDRKLKALQETMDLKDH